MAWARVDDGWWAHPKVLTLDLDARGLWISALSWSCQQQTDLIPEAIVRMCGDDGTVAAKLVTAGLWRGVDGGWVIHDWDDYQSERAKKAAAGRAGGKRSGESRRATKHTDEADERASREAERGASDEAGPTRPGPTQPTDPPPSSGGPGGTSSRGKPRSDRATRLPDGWQPDPEPDLIAAVGGPPAAAAELDRFRDYWIAQPGAKGRKVDWQATWRNWLRRAAPANPNRASPRPQVTYDPDEATRRFELLTGDATA